MSVPNGDDNIDDQVVNNDMNEEMAIVAEIMLRIIYYMG